MDDVNLNAKQKLASKLEAGNQRSYEELKAAIPKFGMDTSDLRRELFYQFMVKWGLVTEEQVLDFEIEFHSQVETALNGAWAQYRAAQDEKPNLTVVKKPAKLLDSHGRPMK